MKIFDNKNRSLLESILPLVEKPGRYVGGEVNAVLKERSRSRVSIALAFPDVYEIGMSHLGIQILYAILNRDPAVLAERVFAPWPDMESILRAEGAPLVSQESSTPLSDFDMVGFSLQYELSYTNVLNMLDLGRIPLHAEDRRDGHPLIVAGGPCTFNPEPMSAFFDALAVGEGEELISELARVIKNGKERGWRRERILEGMAALEGVYVPRFHGNGKIIRKRTVADLNAWLIPEKPVLPLVQAVHDRINLEIARGCTRGCRFCQAGMVWRPVRERTPDVLNEMISGMLSSTGCEEISLLSLSSGDYTRIGTFLPDLMERYYKKRVAISLPSLRVESLTPQLIEAIKRVRKTSFTLAPEAGTERLRKIINKGNTEADLLATVQHVFDAGWKLIKLYFMLGLPGETEEDLEGIVDLSYKVLREGKKGRQVNVSLSTFVPKPHTPFQWHRQIGRDEVLQKQEFLKKRLRNRNLVFKWHDRKMSLLEGLFSRGGRDMAPVIETAFRNGCRFDGWSDWFRFELWEDALKTHRIDLEHALRQRTDEEKFPWDHIDCGLTGDFLKDEYRKAMGGLETPDCRRESCHGCGACSGDIRMISAAERSEPVQAAGGPEMTAPPGSIRKYRIRFAKGGRMRFLSHLETASALVRGIRQAGISFEHTNGFHPHPRISFSSASAVGIESRSEFADIRIEGPKCPVADVIGAVNRNLPSGLEILALDEIPVESESLAKLIYGYRYEIDLPEGAEAVPSALLEDRLRNFHGGDDFILQRTSKGKVVSRDIKPLIEHLSLDGRGRKIHMTLRASASGGVRPGEILAHVLGMDERTVKKIRVMKSETLFA